MCIQKRVNNAILLSCVMIAGCGTKPDHNANWYYYWEKDGVIPSLNRNGSPASRWDWSVDAANQGVFGASHGPSDGYVLTDLCIVDPVINPIAVRHKILLTWENIGAATEFGVEQAAATAEHEIKHILNYRQIDGGQIDTDGDGLADINENGAPYFFIIGETDTYDLATYIHPIYDAYGDNEFEARIAEIVGVAAALKEQDWTLGGAQWRH